MENFDSIFSNLQNKHIHLVGVKGTGVAAFAEILHRAGAILTGSDVADEFYTTRVLRAINLTPLLFNKNNVTKAIDLVIHSAAYHEDTNEDLKEAVRLGVPTMLYTKALGEYSKACYSCGVCGVHGKTSTTGLIGTILRRTPLAFQVLAGSAIKSFSPKDEELDHCTFSSDSFKPGDIFVAETCEYQRHFMDFAPKAILLTSVESDHEDYYPTFADIERAFIDYCQKLPKGGLLVYCAMDAGAALVVEKVRKVRGDLRFVSYGAGDYPIGSVTPSEQAGFRCNEFEVEPLGKFYLRVPGFHEALDAAGALAIVSELLARAGFNPKAYYEDLKQGVFDYQSGSRRSEVLLNTPECVIIDDYGHHPTAIKTTLAGFRDFFPGRKVIVSFQSHTYSRTQALLEDFAKSFESADTVIFHKIYSSARENPKDFSITGRTLYETAKAYSPDAHYFEEVIDAKDFVISEIKKTDRAKYPNGALFVTMGAGDTWQLAKGVKAALEKERAERR